MVYPLEKINVLFLCPVPLLVKALHDLLFENEYIRFDSISCSNLSDFPHTGVNSYKTLIICESLINENDFSKSVKFFAKLKDRVRLILFTSNAAKYFINPFINSWFDFYIEEKENTEAVKDLILHAALWAKPGASFNEKTISKRIKSENRLATLTIQEYRVFKLIGAGYGNKETAQHLNTSIKTIETHKANMISKLHLKGAKALLKFAIKMCYEIILFINILPLFLPDIDPDIFL